MCNYRLLFIPEVFLLFGKHRYEDVIVYGISYLVDDGMGEFSERLRAGAQAGIGLSIVPHQINQTHCLGMGEWVPPATNKL